jgi:hypothetical protein
MKRTEWKRTTGPRGRGIDAAVAKHPSAGRAKFLREFAAAKKVVRARSRGRCEADAVVDCTGRAEHTHHKLGRVHPRANEPDHLLDVCHLCHDWIHQHPEHSYTAGWLLHYEDVPKENDR